MPACILQSSTLVLLPLVYKCRTLGCIYLTAAWDINAALGRGGLGELAQQLAAALFKRLVRGSPLQRQWYCLLLDDRGEVGRGGEVCVEGCSVVVGKGFAFVKSGDFASNSYDNVCCWMIEEGWVGVGSRGTNLACVLSGGIYCSGSGASC